VLAMREEKLWGGKGGRQTLRRVFKFGLNTLLMPGWGGSRNEKPFSKKKNEAVVTIMGGEAE